jgi:transcription elongation factor GreB
MSKAFTSEETSHELPAMRNPPQLRPGEIRYVTPEGFAALLAELSRHRAEARSLGARGKEDQGRRILWLERTLAALTVLSPDREPEGEVGFGTWVTVEEPDGARVTWRLVGPDEADARQGTISALSPVGRALLGRSTGEVVEVERPGGKRAYLIREVGRMPPTGVGRGERGA